MCNLQNSSENFSRILFICDKNACTSFGRLTLNLVKAVSYCCEVHVLWLKTPKYFSKNVNENNANYISHEIWAKSLYTGFYSFKEPLCKLVNSIKPQIVFFIRPELGFLVNAVKNSKSSPRTVMFVHDTFAETLYPNSLKFKLLNIFYIRPSLKADSFVYNSKWTMTEAQKLFKDKILNKPSAVIGCPIDSELFCEPELKPSVAEKKAFLQKYGIKNFDGMCLNVSLDEPRKNIETFFKIAKLRPNVAFVRVGKFSERLRSIVNSENLQNVFHFSEFDAQELRNFYRNTDLMVYPSLLEGFGLPPIEAIACGVPAVCANTSAVAENLNGVCPLIECATDALAYVSVLDKVLLGENVIDKTNAQKLLAKCSMEAFANSVKNFLKSLLNDVSK